MDDRLFWYREPDLNLARRYCSPDFVHETAASAALLAQIVLVGKGGLEPPLTNVNQILSLARLPIPPLAQQYYLVSF